MKNKQKSNLEKLISMLAIIIFFASACNDDDDKKPNLVLSTPVLQNPSEITATSFKASWNRVDRATTYLIDVSKNSNFSSLEAGYNKKEIASLSTTVSGLTAETKYYYRVYAKTGTVVSRASTAKEVTTIK
ncbi:fibronectin type III domain-containing protein [Algoriphagus confluentis]|uniref:Fibronectin type-III domain-containing protein n=1 Tax=Algoriphagus confluentis TaxID=1697556 RepID=A0ABQ6PWI2_9BACT|nr:hypothetical protein Aconfl_41830 [Algoriphagus confluentis]